MSLSSPAAGSTHLGTEKITLKATVSDAQSDSISKVNFYNGNTLLGTDTSSPFSISWTPQTTGTATLKAKAIDAWGSTGTSADVSITLHQKPTVYISGPETGKQYEVGTAVTITATASDDGSISKVEFFQNASSIGTDASAPYSKSWTVSSKGEHSLTAIATDNHGAQSESSPVVVITGYEISAPENPPANFKADTGTANITGKFTLSWNAVTNASTYLLQQCTAGNCASNDNWTTLQNDANRARDFAGLASGAYPFRVAACNKKGCSEYSSVLTVNVDLPTPQRPGKTWLKTTDLCSEGATSGQSTGTFTLCWEAVQGSPTHYVVQEKTGAGGWADVTEVGANNALELTLTRASNDYRYRVMACNQLDNVCSDPGGELLLTVVDTPLPFAAAVACEQSCVQISGLGFDSGTRIEVRSQNSDTLLASFSDAVVALIEGEAPDTLQFSLDAELSAALADSGLRLTLINGSNGNQAQIYAFANNDNPLIDLEGSTPTVDENGVIYVSADNRVYALEKNNGTILSNWPFVAAGDVDSQAALSLNHDTLYVGTTTGILHAIGTAGQSDSGAGRWQTALGDEALAPPVVDELNTVNLGSLNHNFYSVDPDGRIRWTYIASDGIAEKAVPYGDFSLTFRSLDGQQHTIRAGAIGPHLLTWQSRDDSLLADYMHLVGPDFAEYQADGWDVTEMFHVGRLFEGLLQRIPDEETLTFWTFALLNGATLEEVATAFLTSDSGRALYGELSNAGFLQALYLNVLGIGDATAAADYERLLANLNNGTTSRGATVLFFTDHGDFAAQIDQELLRIFEVFYGFCLEADCAFLADEDGDGLGDQWEIEQFGDTTSQSGADDPDDDGLSNYQEYLAGTTPLGDIDPAPTPAALPLPDTGASDVLASDAVGAVGGEFRVSEAGSAAYTIPLYTPQGTAGVVPSLALSYDSQRGNGLLGKGWTLDGLSAVSRCRQTLGQDGEAKPLTWSAEDRFCLDGQRLMVEPGYTYGAVGARYRTEIDSGARVISVGGSLGHPDSFRVIRKDGSLSVYGADSLHGSVNLGNLARQKTAKGTFVWALSMFTDSVGNAIDYLYEDGVQGHRLSEVRYAYGSGTQAQARISLTYENRPDPIKGYMGGELLQSTRRLNEVTVYNTESGTGGETAVRRYELQYNDTETGITANSISRLQRVTTCVNSLCLPWTVFTWTERQSGFSGGNSYPTLENGSDLGLATYRVADINGDGRMDLVYFLYDLDGENTDHRLQYALSNGDTLVTGEFAEGGVYVEYGDNSVPDLHILDYNGDGRHDVAVKHRNEDYYDIYLARPQSDNRWKLSRNALQTEPFGPGASFIDLNSDGLADVQYSDTYGGNFYYRELVRDADESTTSSHFYTFGAERTLTWVDVPVEGVSEYQRNGLLSVGAPDFNADGVVDGVGYSYERIECIDSGFEGETCRGNLSVYALIRESATLRQYGLLWSGEIDQDELQAEARGKVTQVTDINGDGLSDVLTESAYWLNTGEALVEYTLAEATGEQQFPIDYNRDGYPDLLWNDPDENRLKVAVWNSASETFNEAANLYFTGTGDSAVSPLFVDVTGDGWPDYLSIRNAGDETELTIHIATGEDLPGDMITRIDNGLGHLTGITYGSLSNSGHYARMTIDTTTVNGEYCLFNSCVDYVYDQLNVGDFYHRLNGDWDLPEGNHTLHKGDKPVLELMAPVYVVTDVYSSAPTAADASAQSGISYYYGEAKLQAAGRGLLGFEKLTTRDLQTGVTTTTTYRQDFPFVGYPLSTESRTADGDLLSRSDNSWQLQGWDGGAATTPAAPYRPVLDASVEVTYNTSTDRGVTSGLTVSGTPLRTVTTKQSFDAYGNPETVTITTAGNGLTQTKTTVNRYGPNTVMLHDESFGYRELGRLVRTEVTTSRSDDVDGRGSLRISGFTYYESGVLAGLLRTEVIEPDNSELKTTTTYTYDDLGNRISATQSGKDMEDRVTRSECDPYGRYVDVTFNAYGQAISTVLERNALGQATRVADINGVVTTAVYGAFGIPLFEGDQTGAWEQTLSSRCTSDDSRCPEAGAVVSTTTQAGGGGAFVVTDVLGRTVRKASLHFDGSWTYVDTEYDALGRMARTSEPYAAGSGAAYWTGVTYDLLGRVIATSLPGVVQPIQVDYDGSTTVTTNPALQTKTETANALGETVLVEDALGGGLRYRYDAAGNLRFVDSLDESGVAVSTVQMCYDVLGRKTAMLDPDKGGHVPNVQTTCPADTSQPRAGWWLYNYNPFGELDTQIDAKGQTTEMGYDRLGRMDNREDRDSSGGATHQAFWSYNNAVSGRGLGQLSGVADNITGYIRTFDYDSYGRVDETTTNLGGDGEDNHYEKVVYDAYGRTFQVFDAAGKGNWQSNAVQYTYNEHGYLLEIANAVVANGIREIYYHVQNMDRRGNVTEALGGNGVTQIHVYNPATGRLERITANGGEGENDVQDLEYTWDEIGNLLARYDRSGGKDLAEEFSHYDDLNRLRTYAVAGGEQQVVGYDSLGNITEKTGVGTYRYGSECAEGFGPHAVCETVDNAGVTTTYAYDANGNMVSDSSGRTLQYTPFDKPGVIAKGGHTTTFEYAPDRSRFLRTDENEEGLTTTRYIGNVEKITHPNGAQTVKRYLPGNVLVSFESDRGGAKVGTAKRQYLYKDHLGSLDVITDAVGTVVQTMSFDPWGQRRSAVDWSKLDVGSLLEFDHSLTTRGFTGHEMLDEVGLIHMNGRVYDPRLGRFLQADPIIQFPSNTQSYNRYSYVLNNPVRYTDPSGYFIPVVVGIIAAAAGAEAVVVGILVGITAFGQAMAQGASFGQALFTGIISGVAAGAFSAMGGVNFADTAVGQVLGETATEALAYGAVGGITNVLQGGKFGHGFVSAGLGAAVGNIAGLQGNGWEVVAGRALVGVVIGGTISKITGGKFANGAATAAFAAVVSGMIKYAVQKLRDIIPEVDTSMALSDKAELDVGNVDMELSVPDREAASPPELTSPKEAPSSRQVDEWSKSEGPYAGSRHIKDSTFQKTGSGELMKDSARGYINRGFEERSQSARNLNNLIGNTSKAINSFKGCKGPCQYITDIVNQYTDAVEGSHKDRSYTREVR